MISGDYLRALRTLPNLEIYLGHFLTQAIRMRLVSPPPHGAKTVEVFKTEEKGSDVNLAVHLLSDGYKGDYEAALVVSNDSDLGEAVRIVTEELSLKVGIICPSGAMDSYTGKRKQIRKSNVLSKLATFRGETRHSLLAKSQFPPTLTDKTGSFSKPPSW